MADAKDKNEADALPTEHAMAHLFRGELERSDRWRTRLDTTTNWALTTTAAVISFGFASPSSPHGIILVGIWMVVSFLLIEARRYRYYDLWIRRVRLLEDGFWAPMLRREPLDADAMRELAMELSRPQIRLSLASAVATRMNRAYGPILVLLVLTWFIKVYDHPVPARTFGEFVDRAHVGPVSGGAITFILVVFSLLALALFISSFVTRAPLGELRQGPRGQKRALWEIFARPYDLKKPRARSRTAGLFRSPPPGAKP